MELSVPEQQLENKNLEDESRLLESGDKKEDMAPIEEDQDQGRSEPLQDDDDALFKDEEMDLVLEDAELFDNNDLLGEDLMEEEQRIEAISQLFPEYADPNVSLP